MPPAKPDDGSSRIRSVAELREFLRDKDDFDALVQLSEGDLLGLREAVHEWQRRRHSVLDPDRLQAKALAWLVSWGRAPEAADVSLAALLEKALETVGREERHRDVDAAREGPRRERPRPADAMLIRRLGLKPEEAPFAKVAINDLPPVFREAVIRVLLDGQGFTLYAREAGISPQEARDRAVNGLLELKARIDELMKRKGDSDGE